METEVGVQAGFPGNVVGSKHGQLEDLHLGIVTGEKIAKTKTFL